MDALFATLEAEYVSLNKRTRDALEAERQKLEAERRELESQRVAFKAQQDKWAAEVEKAKAVMVQDVEEREGALAAKVAGSSNRSKRQRSVTETPPTSSSSMCVPRCPPSSRRSQAPGWREEARDTARHAHQGE